MIKLEKKKSCIIWILMTVICTFFVCMIGNVSVEAKTVTKDITIGKGKTYAIEQTFSGKATFKTSNKKIAVIKNGKIIGKSIGKAKITIKDKGNTYIYSVCSLSNLFFRFHTTTLTEACSNELKQHHL